MRNIFILIFMFSFVAGCGVTAVENKPQTDQQKVQKEPEDRKEGGSKMSGYYYYGYFDEREKQDSEFEKDYFYYMDHHFKDYNKNMFLLSKDDHHGEEEHIKYFESINGLSLYSIPSPRENVKNGDYITFVAKSPILESYPAQITKIEDVEVLHPRGSK